VEAPGKLRAPDGQSALEIARSHAKPFTPDALARKVRELIDRP